MCIVGCVHVLICCFWMAGDAVGNLESGVVVGNSWQIIRVFREVRERKELVLLLATFMGAKSYYNQLQSPLDLLQKKKLAKSTRVCKLQLNVLVSLYHHCRCIVQVQAQIRWRQKHILTPVCNGDFIFLQETYSEKTDSHRVALLLTQFDMYANLGQFCLQQYFPLPHSLPQKNHPHSLPHFLPHSLPHCSQLQHHFQDCLQHHLPSRSSKSIHVRNLLCTFLQLTMPYQKYMHVVCYFDPTHLLHLKKCLTCRKFSQNLMIGMSIYEIHPKRKN